MKPRKLAIILLMVAFALGAAGCSSSAEEDSLDEIWRPVFEEALENATTDFERAALADRTITRAEYEEAHDRLVECLGDAGFTANLVEDDHGFFQVGLPAGREGSAAYDDCAEGTILVISPIYTGMIANPERRDYEVMIVECLVAEDLVEPDFTKEELEERLAGDTPFITELMSPCMEDPWAIISS